MLAPSAAAMIVNAGWSEDLDGDRLEEDRILAESIRLHDRPVLRLHLRRRRLEEHGTFPRVLDDPHRSPAPHEDSDRKRFVCPANLDLAIGEAKSQDRLWSRGVVRSHELPTLASAQWSGAGRLPPIGYRFDSHDERLIERLAHDPPQLSPPAERFTDLRRGLLRERIHLEVPVWIPDLEQAPGHVRGIPDS